MESAQDTDEAAENSFQLKLHLQYKPQLTEAICATMGFAPSQITMKVSLRLARNGPY
jgi:hypothetical protein